MCNASIGEKPMPYRRTSPSTLAMKAALTRVAVAVADETAWSMTAGACDIVSFREGMRQ